MIPLFTSGDLVVTLYSRAKVGDVVVMNLPDYGYVLKRLKQVQKQSVILGSDNLELFSSCCGVWQSKEYLIGRVLFSINLKRRAIIKFRPNVASETEYPYSN